MKAIPIIKSSDARRSVEFYTKVLDFTQTYADGSLHELPVTLSNGEVTIQLSHEGHSTRHGVPESSMLTTRTETRFAFALGTDESAAILFFLSKESRRNAADCR